MEFSVTAVLILLEIKIGKEGVNNISYYQETGSKAACTNSMMEAKWG